MSHTLGVLSGYGLRVSRLQVALGPVENLIILCLSSYDTATPLQPGEHPQANRKTGMTGARR